ncbi:unnamed protein product [Sphenostylis stenocarpa]|uniref:Uncharacterized protein n=1 Tax=Sphenostylis stenocarpa TaxID=92480 RepID=A0AA86S348_9FABA|nr:unnamed protein product [Sphenostylis stenocarpa]
MAKISQTKHSSTKWPLAHTNIRGYIGIIGYELADSQPGNRISVNHSVKSRQTSPRDTDSDSK